MTEPAGPATSTGRGSADADDELLDVVGIGSALVDVVVRATDDELADLELPKGSMSLVDLERAESIHAALGGSVEMSGGSAANTMAGVASLGGRAGFVGKITDDRLGRVFANEIRASGVTFEPIGGQEAPGTGIGTGRCLVLVTEDAERTMATYLGAATTVVPADVPLDLVGRCQVVYLEGYLWDLPPAIEAMRQAISAGHQANASVALSLSDPFCVSRHQHEFLDLLREDIEVLFGNEEELVALFSATSFDAAIEAAEETGILVAATRGAKGSVVTTAHGPVAVDAAPVERVLDTTGAGDLYAAGFLYGLTHGADPARCAELGGLCAGEIIGHFGARPETQLRALAEEAKLL
jgi:sugar/nucleoside kinase (ribokinase family)